MQWYKLKENKCPKCGKDWYLHMSRITDDGLMIHNCGFKIREKRYREIMSDIVSQEIGDDNLDKEF